MCVLWEAAVVQLEVKRTEGGMAGLWFSGLCPSEVTDEPSCHKKLCIHLRAGIGSKLKLQSAETDCPAVEILYFGCTMLLAVVRVISWSQRCTPEDRDG